MFDTIKAQISVPQAARRYGIDVNRYGKAQCPFHDDHEPSLVIHNDHYHCYGCGAHGDVIDLTARLFALSQGAAAKKLAEDFQIELPKPHRSAKVPAKPDRRQKLTKQFSKWRNQALGILREYRCLLLEWSIDYEPTAQEEWPPLFCEYLQRFDAVDDAMATLLCGSLEEQIDYYVNCRKEVEGIGKRLEEYRRTHIGQIGGSPAGSGKYAGRDPG